MKSAGQEDEELPNIRGGLHHTHAMFGSNMSQLLEWHRLRDVGMSVAVFPGSVLLPLLGGAAAVLYTAACL